MPSPQKQKQIARGIPGVALFHDTADEKCVTAVGFEIRAEMDDPRGSERWHPEAKGPHEKTLRKGFESNHGAERSGQSQGCMVSYSGVGCYDAIGLNQGQGPASNIEKAEYGMTRAREGPAGH